MPVLGAPLCSHVQQAPTHPPAPKQPPAKSTPRKPVSPHRQRPTSEQRGWLEAVTVFISCSQIGGEERKRRRGTHFQRGRSGRAELEFPATLSALPLCSWQVLWKMKMPLNGFHSVVKSNLKAGGTQRFETFGPLARSPICLASGHEEVSSGSQSAS